MLGIGQSRYLFSSFEAPRRSGIRPPSFGVASRVNPTLRWPGTGRVFDGFGVAQGNSPSPAPRVNPAPTLLRIGARGRGSYPVAPSRRPHLRAMSTRRESAPWASAAVVAVLKALWSRTEETAVRLRSRIERVVDAAKAEGLRSGENPARWRGHLDQLLPRRQKLARGHLAAMPYADVPTFMVNLR